MKINMHTHLSDPLFKGIEIINQYPSHINIYLPNFSVGIHPWYIKEEAVNYDMMIIEKALQNPNCVAIGECGLDKKIDVPINLQVQVVKNQLLLAEQYKKAVILHVVSAYQEIIAIKKELKLTVPLVIHGFNKNEQVSESLFKNGFYLSFGKALLKSKSLQNVLKNSPLDKIFLETDGSADCNITEIYSIAATIIPSIEQQIEENYNNVFIK